jgi:hypothetical protein
MTNLLEYASFVLNSIEQGWEVDSAHTDFSKVFDQVRHQLLLEQILSVSHLLEVYGKAQAWHTETVYKLTIFCCCCFANKSKTTT